MKHELRFLKGAELRTAGGKRIRGYAAVFNSWSEDMGFREKISPGAFSRAIHTGQDVRCLFNHDPSQMLGRTRSGTLELREDSNGLWFECNLPDTRLGNDIHTLIARGDIAQCSFGFKVVSDDWNEAGRTLLDVDLLDVSPVTFPAYTQTSVEARASSNYFESTGCYNFRRDPRSGLYAPPKFSDLCRQDPDRGAQRARDLARLWRAETQ